MFIQLPLEIFFYTFLIDFTILVLYKKSLWKKSNAVQYKPTQLATRDSSDYCFNHFFIKLIHTICASLKPWASLGCKIFSSVPSASWWLLLLPHTYTITASFSKAVDADEPALHEHRQLEARVQIYNTHKQIKDLTELWRPKSEKCWVGELQETSTHLFKEAESDMWEATKSISIFLQHLSIDGFSTDSL